ncbi:hypothetical protein H206_03540 [Candidatus Electrothrix aarhusensis]|jgi:hypothetical protein|uniref:Uncharacterized protein n=1 Tax=Candidatus Electrothrix aarhusensis TaxID=1859131 RepID=A0A444J1K0_9BACT|nr:hypothetical protein H206_03540 [Candidatus Electrothrix aarhusensis]
MHKTVSKSGCTPQSVLEELRNSVLRYVDPLEPVSQDDQDSHAELADRLVQQHQAQKKQKRFVSRS